MSDALKHLFEYPLLGAIFGRRARRFGLGMSIPSGPLAFTSRHAPLPLSELGPRAPHARTRPTRRGKGTSLLEDRRNVRLLEYAEERWS